MSHKILLYGANGYTGRLILDELLKQQLGSLLLAGRNENALRPLADSFNLEFDISTASNFSSLLKRHKELVLVINAAGPFIETAEPIAKACIAHGIHYIDVTGEIAVFQQLLELNEKAKLQGVMLLPGAGFDVVPTDCLANVLKAEMPDATELKLAFAGLGGGVSRGTALTAVSQMDAHTWVRQNGKLTEIPWREREQKIDFGPFKGTCLPISWGDLQTAWVSTGVPNISVFIPFKSKTRKWIPFLTRLIQVKPIRKLAMGYIRNKLTGPTSAQREKGQTHLIGEAFNPSGKQIRKHLVTPDGYTFTALSVVAVCKRIFSGDLKPGYQTPTMAYGAKFVEEIQGVSWLER